MHLLTSAAVGIALTSTLVSAASCSSFAPSRDPYTQPALRTFIISKGITCESTTAPCKVDIGGYVTDTRTLNITVDAADTNAIYSTIASNVNFTFNTTTTTPISGIQTWPIANGTSGYVGFTTNHRCTAGKLSGCDEEALEGMDVEACTPILEGGELSGTIAAIATDRSTALAVTCNPANTTAAKNGNNSNTCDAAETGDAVRLGDVSMVLFVGSLVVAVFGFGGL
ncbi:hypothetical protein E4T52_04815 [Aureobasidium sp. EXF-3400]|nr:hypothetical protein E4T51_03954 [Aureobasidium sp. EXF-12344]KAI4780278.1 hypothetical protein E4T52_04815 [Aureobasidium sp. EXF-3400]